MQISVALEPAVRLMGSLLAAGEWPLSEQAAKAHLAHRQAEQARRALVVRQADPLVVWANQVALAHGPGALLRHVLGRAVPFDLDLFAQQPGVQDLWTEQGPDWYVAAADLAQVLDRPDWAQPLIELFAQRPATVTVTPNLLVPALRSVTAEHEARLVVASPPPLAWGTSPPWRYGERPEEALAAVAAAMAHHLIAPLAPDLAAERAEQLASAIASLVLRDQFGPAAADQYLLIEKRTRKWPGLPALAAMLSVLRRQAPGASWVERVFPSN